MYIWLQSNRIFQYFCAPKCSAGRKHLYFLFVFKAATICTLWCAFSMVFLLQYYCRFVGLCFYTLFCSHLLVTKGLIVHVWYKHKFTFHRLFIEEDLIELFFPVIHNVFPLQSPLSHYDFPSDINFQAVKYFWRFLLLQILLSTRYFLCTQLFFVRSYRKSFMVYSSWTFCLLFIVFYWQKKTYFAARYLAFFY